MIKKVPVVRSGFHYWRGDIGKDKGVYSIEFAPVLEVFEIGIVGVPFCDKVKEQLSAGKDSRADLRPCEALIASERLEGDNGGMLAEQYKGAGKTRRRDAAEGRSQDFEPTWRAVEKCVEGHSSTARVCLSSQ
jgi:hypothetical protein